MHMKRILLYISIVITGASVTGCAIRTPHTFLRSEIAAKDTLRLISSVIRTDNTDLTFADRSGVYSGQGKEITGVSEHYGNVALPLSSIVSCDISPASGILTIGVYFFGIVAIGLILLLVASHQTTPPVY
jgi:hypothetical protein